MPDARIDPLAAPSVAHSPTGTPLLPVWLVPWLIGVVGGAELLAQLLPAHTLGAKAAHVLAGLGALFGLASPGLRRR